MSEENPILSFNDAFAALNSASEAFKVDVWVPSLEKYLTFKEIDAKQQKNILSSAIDNSVYSSDFVKVFYNILKENILNEDNSIIDNLTITDRSFIAIALRKQISSEVSVSFLDTLTEKVSLDNIISNFGSYVVPKSETIEVTNNNVTISTTVSIPTIKDELIYEEEFQKTYKKVDDIKTTKDVQSLVSEAFIGETSKYISNVSVNGAEFNFKDLTFNQKIKVVEKLPSGLIQKTLEVISNWKKNVDSFLTVTSGENSKVISIDSVLFLS